MANSLTQLALKKFKKNRSGLFSFWFIVICGIVAVFAYAFAPDDSSNANQMHLEIHSKKPGFTVQMLTIPSAMATEWPLEPVHLRLRDVVAQKELAALMLTKEVQVNFNLKKGSLPVRGDVDLGSGSESAVRDGSVP